MSVAVGAVQLTTAEQFPASFGLLIGEGHPLITGFSVSLTVTANEQYDLFPEESSAVYVTVVTPFGNVAPGL